MCGFYGLRRRALEGYIHRPTPYDKSRRKFKSRSPVLAAEQQTVQSAITITQSCQRTIIHAQQRFVTAAKYHP